jgi:hypothetical protein
MTIVTLVSGYGNAYPGDGTRDGGGQARLKRQVVPGDGDRDGVGDLGWASGLVHHEGAEVFVEHAGAVERRSVGFVSCQQAASAK